MRRCNIKGCRNKHRGRGYCHRHYMHWYHGKLGLVFHPNKCAVCGVDCGKATYCRRHWEKEVFHKRKPLYHIWLAMKQRCYNPNSQSFHHYGGRGIKVCERWVNDYHAFEKDMGKRPSILHSIERIDVNGDYEPGNCKWALQVEQNRNRRPDNKSGFSGVSWYSARDKWVAHISVNNKKIHLGYFTKKESAIRARQEAEAKYWRLRKCEYRDCERPHYGRGFCNKHYQQWYKGRLGIVFLKQKCRLCGAPAHAKFLCPKHYMAKRRRTVLNR